MKEILPGLTRQNLGHEVLAGVTLLAIAPPLNIGYAQIAGLPATAGLCALVPLSIVFALLTSSRHLVAAPDAAAATLDEVFAFSLGVLVPRPASAAHPSRTISSITDDTADRAAPEPSRSAESETTVSIGSYLPDQRCRAGFAWNLSSVTREGTPLPKPIHRFQALLPRDLHQRRGPGDGDQQASRNPQETFRSNPDVAWGRLLGGWAGRLWCSRGARYCRSRRF